MQNFMKTILSAVQTWTKGKIKESTADWNQNDSSADSYVKNRTHWEENSILVDNLTYEEYESGNFPACSFIPGEKYNVIWNGTLYKDLICYHEEGFNVIASDINNCPFYIDDDGGNGLYIESGSGTSFVVSIVGKVIHKLDSKYLDLPENLATIDDVQEAVDLANTAQATAESAQTNADMAKSAAEIVDDKLSTEITNRKAEDNKKMDKNNPVGTGSLSMNRAGTVGKNSTTLGDGCIALGLSQSAFGQYNVNTAEWRNNGWVQYGSAFRFSKTGTYYYATEYEFNEKTGIYTLINPKKASGSEIFSIGVTGLFFVVGEFSNGDTNVKENTFSGNELIKTEGTDFSRSEKDTYYRIFTPNYKLGARYQFSNEKGTYIHFVGNGTSDTARSNAHTLDWEGNAWYQGDVYVGSTSGTNRDDGSKKLATEEYVDAAVTGLGDLIGDTPVAEQISTAISDSGFVSYATVQDLTDEQKAQARENIGALNDNDIIVKLFPNNVVGLDAPGTDVFKLNSGLYVWDSSDGSDGELYAVAEDGTVRTIASLDVDIWTIIVGATEITAHSKNNIYTIDKTNKTTANSISVVNKLHINYISTRNTKPVMPVDDYNPATKKYVDDTAKKYADDMAKSKITTPSAAEVGQTIVVKEVDETGNPIEWGTADFPGQPDWNALEGEPGYIANRTHWKEITYEQILAKEIDCVLNGNPYALMAGIKINAGGEYCVIINGTRYMGIASEVFIPEEIATVVGVPSGNAVVVGNKSHMYLGDNTGEPFLLGYMPSIARAMMLVKLPDPVSFQISSLGVEYHKISNEYLPATDWDAAEGESGHVLNRTHWKDATETVIFSNATVNVNSDNEYSPTLELTTPLVIGNTYKVVYNGEEYICVCRDDDGMCIGANSLPDDVNNIPFMIYEWDGEFYLLNNEALEGTDVSVEIEISVIEYTYHTLDRSYIPGDWIATEVPGGSRTLIEDTTAAIGGSSDKSLQIYNVNDILPGCVVTMTYDGESYTCKIFNAQGGNNNILYFGNASLGYHDFISSTSDTGEPFLALILKENIPLTESTFKSKGIYLKGQGSANLHKFSAIIDGVLAPDPLPQRYLTKGVPVVQSASVGQMIVVKEVDDNGKPTKWETVDRTHSSEMITIFEEATVTATNEVGYSIPGLGAIKYGHKYRVTFNDVVYNLTGKLYNGFDTYIGNIPILTGDGEDTGEPFAIGSGPNFGGTVFEWTIGAEISGGIKIKVEEEVVNKLPQKYSDTTHVIEITAFDGDYHINKTCESLFDELYDAIIHNKIIVAKITDISYDSNYNYTCNVSYLPCSHFDQVDDSGGIISFGCITGSGSSAMYKNLIIAYTSPTNEPNLIINKYKIALTV